jgi:hypothetical protein
MPSGAEHEEENRFIPASRIQWLKEGPVKRRRVEDLAVLHTSCCGIDVHQKSISACVLAADHTGKLVSEVRQFGTATRELLALSDWLAQFRVTHVGMESTGVYWKPIFNLLGRLCTSSATLA